MLDLPPVRHMPPLLRAERELAQARLAAAEGRPEGSGLMADAVLLLRKAGSPFHLAHGLLDSACLEMDRGEFATAKALLDEAGAIGRDLGCRPLIERATDLTIAGESAVG